MIKLITENRDVFGLVVMLGASLVANILMHWILICTYLYRHGERLPTGLLFWRMFAELRRYRELKSRAAEPFTFYYLGFIMTWFNLLLALAIALRLLWIQSHPGEF
jgi:hypothetical protein